MKKEIIPIALGSLIIGFVLGIAFPKLFPDQHDHQHDQQQAAPAYQPPPSGAPGGGQLAQDQYGQKQRDHAIKEYKKLLDQNPQDKMALLGIANLYFDSNLYADAIQHYQKYLAFEPKNSDARVDLAVMYRRSGKADRAIPLLKEVIKDDPKHLIAKMNLGIILFYDMKRAEEAIESWNDFLKTAPNHREVKTIKGLIQEAEKSLAAIPKLPEKAASTEQTTAPADHGK